MKKKDIDLEFNKNEDSHKLAISRMNSFLDQIKLGGGEKRLNKIKEKGKMTARERVDYLVDEDTFFEIGAFAAFNMYKDCLLYTSDAADE